jgi:heat shock protein HtpX
LQTTFVAALLTVIFVTTGKALGGKEGALIAFILASACHTIAYWYSDKIVLRIYGAKEIQPDDAPCLYRIVQDLTFRAEMPMPKIYLISRYSPNAFATGRDEKHAGVVVTKSILQTPDETRLRRVLAQELSQIKNRDRLVGTIAATASGAISMLAYMVE